jgi:hypothetical protein
MSDTAQIVGVAVMSLWFLGAIALSKTKQDVQKLCLTMVIVGAVILF